MQEFGLHPARDDTSIQVQKFLSVRVATKFDGEFSYGCGIARLRPHVTNIFAYPARNITFRKVEKLSWVHALMIFDSDFSYGCGFVRLRHEGTNIFACLARNITFMNFEKLSWVQALMIFDRTKLEHNCCNLKRELAPNDFKLRRRSQKGFDDAWKHIAYAYGLNRVRTVALQKET